MEVVPVVVAEEGHEEHLTGTELLSPQCVGTSRSRSVRLCLDSPAGQSLSKSAGNITEIIH